MLCCLLVSLTPLLLLSTGDKKKKALSKLRSACAQLKVDLSRMTESDVCLDELYQVCKKNILLQKNSARRRVPWPQAFCTVCAMASLRADRRRHGKHSFQRSEAHVIHRHPVCPLQSTSVPNGVSLTQRRSLRAFPSPGRDPGGQDDA